MRKKIKKIICILSAVVIAFSCFSVSAAETDEYTSEEFFNSVSFVGLLFASTLDGTETFIEVSSVEIEGNTGYYTFKTDKNNPFFSSDFLTFFFFEQYNNLSSDDYGVGFYFPENISCDVETSIGLYENFNLSFAPEFGFYISVFPLPQTPALCLVGSSDITEFTVAMRFSSDFEVFTKNRPLVDNRSFYSDIKTFLGSSINWVTQIFNNLTKNPPTLILVICFSVVGFAYAMLYKFIGYKR